MKRIILLLGCFFLAGALLFAAGDQETTSTENTAGEKTEADVIRLEGGDYGYPSPYTHYPRGPGGFKMMLIFDSLLERSEDGLIPWLAEDYEIKGNGKQYLFTIRDGVTWHDGEPLTVEDVKFSFEYPLEHPMAWPYISKAEIEKVEIINDSQVMITAKNVNASLLYNFGRSRIIPKHIWENVETPKEYTKPDAVIGTGPYVLTDYSKEHGTYRFEAYENFWGPEQAVNVIEFVPVSEPVLAFENGEIDLTRISPDLLDRYQENPEYKVVQRPAFWAYRFVFNMKDIPEFQNKKVRQAFSYAIDSVELIEKIERGAGVPGSAGILPPDHIYYNPDVKKYGYDPERAKRLLDEAGVDDPSYILKARDNRVRLAELVREQLDSVGIDVTIKSSDRATHDGVIDKMEYELAIVGHGGWGGEPDYLIERFVGENVDQQRMSSTGAKGYTNPELNSLLFEQQKAFDSEKREELLHEAQVILSEDVPEIPLYYTAGYTVYRPEKYDGWMFMFDHHSLTHSKLSYLKKE